MRPYFAALMARMNEPENIRRFGEALARYRSGAGLSQRALSQRLTSLDFDVSPQAVSGWERGEYRPASAEMVSALDSLLEAEGELVKAYGRTPGGSGPAQMPPEFRAAVLALHQAAGAMAHMLRSTMESLAAKDVDAAITMMQPVTATMDEVQAISRRLVEMDPSLAEDVVSTLSGLMESMGEVLGALHQSRDEVQAQLDAHVAELAELEGRGGLTGDSHALAANAGTDELEPIDPTKGSKTRSGARKPKR